MEYRNLKKMIDESLDLFELLIKDLKTVVSMKCIQIKEQEVTIEWELMTENIRVDNLNNEEHITTNYISLETSYNKKSGIIEINNMFLKEIPF